MGLEDQANVNRLAEISGTDDMVVLLGQPDANSAGLFAETVTRGDPTWAGPLAAVPLGLPAYHVLEPEIKATGRRSSLRRTRRPDGGVRRRGGIIRWVSMYRA